MRTSSSGPTVLRLMKSDAPCALARSSASSLSPAIISIGMRASFELRTRSSRPSPSSTDSDSEQMTSEIE